MLDTEKMHEELINFDESEHIYNFGKYYIHFTDNLMSHKIKNSIKKIKKFKIEKNFHTIRKIISISLLKNCENTFRKIIFFKMKKKLQLLDQVFLE